MIIKIHPKNFYVKKKYDFLPSQPVICIEFILKVSEKNMHMTKRKQKKESSFLQKIRSQLQRINISYSKRSINPSDKIRGGYPFPAGAPEFIFTDFYNSAFDKTENQHKLKRRGEVCST